ncbi:MAG: hypothetical protein WKG07_42915 [Hymenobacter sp.]
MKALLPILLAGLALSAAAPAPTPAKPQALFDGKTTQGWHTYLQPAATPRLVGGGWCRCSWTRPRPGRATW